MTESLKGEDQPEFRLGSDTPFLIGLGILGGSYAIIILAMIVADLAYLDKGFDARCLEKLGNSLLHRTQPAFLHALDDSFPLGGRPLGLSHVALRFPRQTLP